MFFMLLFVASGMPLIYLWDKTKTILTRFEFLKKVLKQFCFLLKFIILVVSEVIVMSRMGKELKEFKKFKETYSFKPLKIEQKGDELYVGKDLLMDNEANITVETDAFINVGYKFKGEQTKLLSNLYPYEFMFKGKEVKSIEGVLQGIKFKGIKEQNLVLTYSGTDAKNIKFAVKENWQDEGIVYWQGKPFKRDSVEFDNFIDELYISAIQNPLYRNVIKKTNKYVLHSIGGEDKTKTILTRFEFEKILNALSCFLKSK